MTKSYPPMSPKEFEAARQYFDLHVERFAVLVGVQWRQGRRYQNGDSKIPNPVAKLIRTAINHGLGAEDIG